MPSRCRYYYYAATLMLRHYCALHVTRYSAIIDYTLRDAATRCEVARWCRQRWYTDGHYAAILPPCRGMLILHWLFIIFIITHHQYQHHFYHHHLFHHHRMVKPLQDISPPLHAIIDIITIYIFIITIIIFRITSYYTLLRVICHYFLIIISLSSIIICHDAAADADIIVTLPRYAPRAAPPRRWWRWSAVPLKMFIHASFHTISALCFAIIFWHFAFAYSAF